jgi:uncharacterized membrane protein
MIDQTKLTKKEIKELQGIIAISTSLMRIGLFVFAHGFVAFFLFRLFGSFTSGLLFHILWITPTIVLAAFIFKISGKWTGGSQLRKEIREDLKNGKALLNTIEATEAIEIQEEEDEGIGFILKLSDSDIFFAQGQEVDQWKRRGFPWTKFTIRSTPISKRFLGVKREGEKLKPIIKRPPLTIEEMKMFDMNASYTIGAFDFEKFKYPNKKGCSAVEERNCDCTQGCTER